MMVVLRLAGQEAQRLLLSRRWLVVGVFCLIAAYLAASDLARATAGVPFSPSAWDVHAVAVNGFLYIGYLVLVPYIALVGDTLVDDRETGFAWIILPRSRHRLYWWGSKIAGLLVVAIVVQLVFLAMCVLVGALLGGWSLSTTASSYATSGRQVVNAVSDEDAGQLVLLFSPARQGQNMAWRAAVVCMYEALAFTAIGAFLLGVTVRFSRAFIPVTAALLGLLTDYILGHFFAGWLRFSPGRRLLESIHSSWTGFPGLSWSTSIAFWLLLLVASVVGGGLMLRRADI